MLLVVNLCGVGHGEQSIDGATIGLLRYDGPSPMVNILKLYGFNDEGQIIAVGPMTTSVDEPGLTFTGMNVADNYFLLEYIPEPNVQVVGFTYDLSGPPGGGNPTCLVKLVPLEAGGWEWVWVKCGGNWNTGGSFLWSRNSSPSGGYTVRVLEIDTREVLETSTAEPFIEKVILLVLLGNTLLNCCIWE